MKYFAEMELIETLWNVNNDYGVKNLNGQPN